jgi:predicted dehydrogenase
VSRPPETPSISNDADAIIHPTPFPKVVLIGCGRITEFAHAPVLRDGAGPRVVGLVDDDPERADGIARLLGGPGRIATYRRIGDAPFDAATMAVVATPTPLHADTAAEALAAAPCVLVEKPLAATGAAARRLLDLARRTRRHLLCVHNRRHEPALRRLLEVCASGTVGRPRTVTYLHHTTAPFPGAWAAEPMWRSGTEGGCLVDLGYHGVYLTREILAAPVAGAEAVETVWRGPVLERAAVRTTHIGGAGAAIDVAWTASSDAFRVVVDCSAGRVTADDTGRLSVATAAGGEVRERHPAGFGPAYRALYADAARRTAGPPRYDQAATAVETADVLDTLAAACRARRPEEAAT